MQSVTVTFLTLAFGQLWHVFDMRSRNAGIFDNQVTRNSWIWAAIVLCTLLLAVPPYVAPAADLLELAPLTQEMWSVVLACSLAPLLVNQVVIASSGRGLGKRR